MRNNDLATKEKIINTVVDMLHEMDDPSKITIRQIAKRVGIGIGLINYHFQTREALINMAIVRIMEDVALKLNDIEKARFDNPELKLKDTLKELSDLAIQNSKFLNISAQYELLHGEIQTPLYYVPLLSKIYNNQKDESELRIIALQLHSIMQVVFLRSSAFQAYSGIDIYNKQQRDKFIDMCVDNLIK
ncbi:TetR/AcrR family transcriptional regulator [Clostridium paridis]|uniref:TetR/AcrR family transcriptional regulator n=1 Tax=Clostridium paridis TaxID=2803863 RepID=A0A937K650_9CLOT|nr:TetR/AcrR family transcriptional regulator [Clostridium paridis]MBL4933328.1 TetR/AcrR family transcriptional regulator [Clostridium paridis]